MLDFFKTFETIIKPLAKDWPTAAKKAYVTLLMQAKNSKTITEEMIEEIASHLGELRKFLIHLKTENQDLEKFTSCCLLAEANCNITLAKNEALILTNLLEGYTEKDKEPLQIALCNSLIFQITEKLGHYSNTVLDCLGIIENYYYYQFQDVDFFQATAKLANLYASWFYEFNRQARAFPSASYRLFAQDFEKLIKDKNERHQKLGSAFQAKVIYQQQTTTLSHINPVNFQNLCQLVQKIRRKEIGRRQVLLYANTSFSHCMGLDIALDSEGTLLILFFEPAMQCLQYELLNMLEMHLIKEDIPFKIATCQSRLQKSAAMCDTFSYTFISESAKHCLEGTFKQLSSCEQPTFYNGFSKNIVMPALKKTTWFEFKHLPWPKLLLTKQSFTELKSDLDDLEQRLGKIRIGDNPDLVSAKALFERHSRSHQDPNHFNNYIEQRSSELYEKLTKPRPPLALQALCAKYRRQTDTQNPTPQQALRRAAAGFLSKRLMQQLIQYLTTDAAPNSYPLDAKDDNPRRQKTALHLSLEEKNPLRAAMLIQAGAKGDIEDAEKNTAASLYLKSEDSGLKRNGVLVRKFR